MSENSGNNERHEIPEADLLYSDLRRLFVENEAAVGTGKITLALISGVAHPDDDSAFAENVLVANSIDDDEPVYTIMMHDNEKPDEEVAFVVRPNRTDHLIAGTPEASAESIETLRYIVSIVEVDNIVAQALADDIQKRH